MGSRENVFLVDDRGPALVLPLAGLRILEESERGHPRPRVGRDHVLADAEHEPAVVAAKLARNRAAFYHLKC